MARPWGYGESWGVKVIIISDDNLGWGEIKSVMGRYDSQREAESFIQAIWGRDAWTS